MGIIDLAAKKRLISGVNQNAPFSPPKKEMETDYLVTQRRQINDLSSASISSLFCFLQIFKFYNHKCIQFCYIVNYKINFRFRVAKSLKGGIKTEIPAIILHLS